MLFSATLSHRVMELAYEHMNEPELIRIEPDKVTVDRVRQAIFFPSNEEKMPLLVGLIREMGSSRIMVFVNMKREAERVEAYLEANDVHAKAISGDVPQKKRLRMLMQFQSGELPVLIGTDVASRGLHIPDVQYVINFDLPHEREDYVHRIGRTARAGAAGDAISFGCETYAISLPDIEDYIGHKIPVAKYDPALLPELIKPRPRPRRQSGPRRSQGHSRRRSTPKKR
jgi:ATP-dependent RNA helicase RhlB